MSSSTLIATKYSDIGEVAVVDNGRNKYFTPKFTVTFATLISVTIFIIVSWSQVTFLQYLFPTTTMIGHNLADTFDIDSANLTVKLCAYSVCPPDNYLSQSYHLGDNIIFNPTYKILGESDVNGYIGFIPFLKFICVVLRGTESESNWVVDLKFGFAEYPKCSGCKVHEGFYEAEQNVSAGVEKEVARLLQLYPDYAVILTGHSLGAAIATLLTIDLIDSGIMISNNNNIKLFTFGSPRVGNPALSSWISSKLPVSNRITHCKDPVPHYPPGIHDCFLWIFCGGYQHITKEWYEECDQGSIRSCNGPEDRQCAGKYDILETINGSNDHINYLHEPIRCPI